MECGAPVGAGTITFSCDLPLPRDHKGPHRAKENAPSVERRRRWEAEQKALEEEENPLHRLHRLQIEDGRRIFVEPVEGEYIPPAAPILGTGESIQDRVIRDIKAQTTLAMRRYGAPPHPDRGPDALMEAYENALALACYLKQRIVERDEAPGHQ